MKRVTESLSIYLYMERKESDRLYDGELKVECQASTLFIAECLYQILDQMGARNRKAVELATTRYYTEVLNL